MTATSDLNDTSASAPPEKMSIGLATEMVREAWVAYGLGLLTINELRIKLDALRIAMGHPVLTDQEFKHLMMRHL